MQAANPIADAKVTGALTVFLYPIVEVSVAALTRDHVKPAGPKRLFR